MHESTKGTSVEDHVRQLRRYKRELVRDLAYGTVRLPASWLAPGDATILALDAEARLDADQADQLKVLLVQCVRLVDLIESLISGFIEPAQAAGLRFTKNDLESLRRGRGPGRVRDLLFLRCGDLARVRHRRTSRERRGGAVGVPAGPSIPSGRFWPGSPRP